MHERELTAYLDECRALVIDEIRAIVARRHREGPGEGFLYELMLDYPLRDAKGLRPALCVATCRALGGKLEAVVRSAAVLELYHNAFLIHDDIEDESLVRRGRPTLHREHGVPIAINVGDAMLALSLQPLLDNIETIGLGPALRTLRAVARMTRESVEGQALELDWVRRGDDARLADADYVRMVEGKTCWYSFITPIEVGAIAAGAGPDVLEALREFARVLGVAFQIQDDVLNLAGEIGSYGKEIGGDLWEGKRTLILLHCLRTVGAAERAEILAILAKPRPSGEPSELHGVHALLASLVERGELSPAGRDAIVERLGAGGRASKTEADVRRLFALVRAQGSIDYARAFARSGMLEARRRLQDCHRFLPASVHRDFLDGLVDYVFARDR
ncbi:polyprenyl synthetase family protein [Nannocystaceae bacterium ST9]